LLGPKTLSPSRLEFTILPENPFALFSVGSEKISYRSNFFSQIQLLRQPATNWPNMAFPRWPAHPYSQPNPKNRFQIILFPKKIHTRRTPAGGGRACSSLAVLGYSLLHLLARAFIRRVRSVAQDLTAGAPSWSSCSTTWPCSSGLPLSCCSNTSCPARARMIMICETMARVASSCFRISDSPTTSSRVSVQHVHFPLF
jgi:hypothetical protein